MDILKVTPSLASRGRDVEKTGNDEQAGRGETSFGAKRNSAELRSKQSTTTGLCKSLDSLLQEGQSSAQAQSSTIALSRRASYVPAVPSPLNPTSSHSSTGDSNKKQLEKMEKRCLLYILPPQLR